MTNKEIISNEDGNWLLEPKVDHVFKHRCDSHPLPPAKDGFILLLWNPATTSMPTVSWVEEGKWMFYSRWEECEMELPSENVAQYWSLIKA